MRILYIVFFTILFLFLFASLVLYAACAIVNLFEDKEENLSYRVFAVVITFAIDALFGWMLLEGYRYILSMGP